MTLPNRLLNLLKSLLNDCVSRMENKQKLLNIYIRDMEHEIRKSEKSLLHLKREKAGYVSDLKKCVSDLKKNDGDVAMAVTKKRDGLAKLLIRNQKIQIQNKKRFVKSIRYLNNEIMQMFEKNKFQIILLQRIKIRCVKLSRISDQENSYNYPDRFCRIPDDFEIEKDLLALRERFRGGNHANTQHLL